MKIAFNFIFVTFVGYFSIANAQTWERIATTNEVVYTLEEYNNQLVAGGKFSTVDGNFTSTIATWDGTTWSALGQGNLFQQYEVCTNLKVFNSILYASGSLKINGNNDYSYGMSTLSGINWSTNIFNQDAYFCLNLARNTFMEYQSMLYATGDFCNSYNTCGYANFIARTSGGAWLPLDNCETNNNSATTVVEAMAVHHDTLFMSISAWRDGQGGTFDVLASWDGTNFDVLYYLPTSSDLLKSMISFQNELYVITEDNRLGIWDGSQIVYSDLNIFPNQFYKFFGVNGDYLYIHNNSSLVRYDGNLLDAFTSQILAPECLINFQGNFYGGFGDGVFKLNAPEWTGLKGQEKDQLSIYPNPSKSQVMISLADANLEVISLKDTYGRKVNLEVEQNQHQLLIKRGNLPSGIYYVEVMDEHQEISKQRIVFN